MGSVSIEIADPAHAFRVAEHGTAGSNEALARARTDTDGGFRLGGLPHDAELRLLVRPPPGFVRPDPIPVRSGDASVRVVLSAGVDAVVHVVDGAGEAIDAVVVIEVVRDGSAVRVASSTTDATGRAKTPSLDAGTPHRLRVFPQSRPDLLSRAVDPWAPADVTVVLREPVPLEGIVVGPDGNGVQARVFGRSPTEAGTWQAISCDVTGRFRSTAFGEGPVRIRVDAEGFARREVVTLANADAPTLRIVLARGAVWRFSVDGWPADRTGGVSLRDESGPAREDAVYGEVDGTGAFTVREADPSKRYRVWIPPEDGDGYALARDLQPSDEVTHLAFARGGSIRGTVRLPEGIQNLECRATCDGLFAQGFATPDGAIEVRGIPSGRWTVTVRGRTDLCHWKGSAEASPGDDVRIVLEPTESD